MFHDEGEFHLSNTIQEVRLSRGHFHQALEVSEKHLTAIGISQTHCTKRKENVRDHGQEPISTICASLYIQVHRPCDYYSLSCLESHCFVHMERPTWRSKAQTRETDAEDVERNENKVSDDIPYVLNSGML
jgi:hypothetical protein